MPAAAQEAAQSEGSDCRAVPLPWSTPETDDCDANSPFSRLRDSWSPDAATCSSCAPLWRSPLFSATGPMSVFQSMRRSDYLGSNRCGRLLQRFDRYGPAFGFRPRQVPAGGTEEFLLARRCGDDERSGWGVEAKSMREVPGQEPDAARQQLDPPVSHPNSHGPLQQQERLVVVGV